MKSIIIASLLIIMVVAVTVGFRGSRAINMTPQLSTKDLSEHSLTIISPSDDSYTHLITSLTEGNPDASIIEAMRPYSVFVKNNSNRAVVACQLKWELMSADGAVTTETTGFIATWRLMKQGAKGTGDLIIRPNSTRLFLPSNLDVSQEKGASTPANPAYQRMQAEYIKELTYRFGKYIGITVSVDGVFFDDGTFVGADTTGFFAQVEALRDARHDLYSELSQGVEEGKSISDLLDSIGKLAAESQLESKSNPSPQDIYEHTRKSVAEEILRMRRRAGDEKTMGFLQESISGQRVYLKKR